MDYVLLCSSRKMHIRPIPLVEELQSLAPELRVRGGSFAHWLPEPFEVPQLEREGILLATRREAIRQCLTDLLECAGLPAVEPTWLPSGARNWPEGYTGSVSKKGTNVVAAIAPTDQMKSIGIDIERLDSRGLPTLGGLDATEQPYAVSGNDGQIVLFSVKEAVYKAINPILGHRLDFTDVATSWTPTDAACRSGVASACGVKLAVRCSIAIPSWITSVALWPMIE